MVYGATSKSLITSRDTLSLLTLHTDVEGHLRTIFRRCVVCPPGSPSCPACGEGETCSLQAESCTACASTVCISTASLPGQSAPPPTPVGAIVGGVVGGAAFVVVVTYLLWRFWIKPRRRQWDQQVWTDQGVEKRDQSSLNRSARQSTRSAHSIASTVLTRASNVIQIAYIPGVTNRSPPDSPGLVPPIPPVPLASGANSTASTPYMEQDQHFFMPGDLRDSTYSGLSEFDRSSIAPSLARASVATNAQIGPAQQARIQRPAVVSVHLPPGAQPINSPPVPQVPKGLTNTQVSISGRNLTPRPIQVKKSSSGQRVPTLANLRAQSARSDGTQTSSSTHPTSLSNTSEPESAATPTARPQHQSEAVTMIDGSPVSPFVRPKPSFTSTNSASSSAISSLLPANNGLPPDVQSEVTQDGSVMHRRGKSQQNEVQGLTSMIEDAMNRAARDVAHVGAIGSSPPMHNKNDSGPFSDANEVTENA